jgi:sterol desaturase/sphingolipid hydroxylase (fatty acid hydroxylase superfamily)
MIHHFRLYGPPQAMRAPAYKNATEERKALGNVGMEWLLPSAALLGVCWAVLRSFEVSWRYQALALATLLAWPVFMFSYLHDRMHLDNFWMARTPLLRAWFVSARRLHDIHHHSLDNDGRIDRNFGIGFFFFDRVFRTLSHCHCPLNFHGYRAAMKRYALEKENDDEFTHFPSGYRI